MPRSTPDYFALRVLNTILGGAFTSRLNNNLREVHGYAYGASSRFEMQLSAGPFFAAAGVQTDKTAEALKEFFNELNGIHQPIPADELDKAKNYLALQMPRNFETTRGTANSLALAYLYDLPADYYATYAAPRPRRHRRRRETRRRQVHSARQVRGGDRRRPQADRAGHQGAESRSTEVIPSADILK